MIHIQDIMLNPLQYRYSATFKVAYKILNIPKMCCFFCRSLMYSEANRRETFTSWPHAGYRWAQPDPMAQAGFYHQVGA